MPRTAPRRTVSQRELAAILGMSVERIRQLVHDGLPRTSSAGKPRYVPATVVAWLLERDRTRALHSGRSSSTMREELARRTAAEARLKEFHLEQRRRELIPRDEFFDVLQAITGGLFAVAIETLGRFERQIVQTMTHSDARRLTETMSGALLQGALGFAETLEQAAEVAGSEVDA